MSRKPTITIVGPGNLGGALAAALHEAGYRIDEIVSRAARDSQQRARTVARRVGAQPKTTQSAVLSADIIWLCVKDTDIAATARMLAQSTTWKGRCALHSSGALTSDELDALRRRGAAVASVHPMMTFVRSSVPSLRGVGFAVEGDRAAIRVARQIVRNLRANVFTIKKAAKPLYHAWGAFASPLLIMELAVAEKVARAAGVPSADVRKIIEPIVRRTIDNYFRHGAAQAFSGPFIRGDIATVRQHLKELARVPGAREVYLALALSALWNLPVGKTEEMEKLLKNSAGRR
ncbi:MAG: Rossmann-like and DUF2520 domain-containing protein [Terriglobales bacterium]